MVAEEVTAVLAEQHGAALGMTVQRVPAPVHVDPEIEARGVQALVVQEREVTEVHRVQRGAQDDDTERQRARELRREREALAPKLRKALRHRRQRAAQRLLE